MIRRTLERCRPALPTLGLATVAMVIVVATNGISLMTLQPIIDRIFVAPGDNVELIIPRTTFSLGQFTKSELLMYLTGFFLVSRGIYAFALYTQRRLMMVAGEIVVHGLRVDLYGHLLTLPPSFYSRRRSGEMVANVTSDLGLVQHLASTVTADLIRRPFEIPFLIALLFWMNSRLATISLLVAPFVVIIVRLLGRASRRRSGRMQSRMSDIAGVLAETVSGIRVIQAFTSENLMRRKFHELASDYFSRARRAYGIIAAATPITEIVTATAIAAIIIVGGQEVLSQSMTTGSFFAFMAVLMATYQPVKTLVNALSEANRAGAALERVYTLLDTKPEVASGTKPARFFKSILFERVSFAFENETMVLENINLEVKRGETVAIVGPSGAGKTTLLSLIPRFIDPGKGRVLLDDTDLRELDLESLRKLIGIVTQDTFLFNDTVRANVALGKPGATDNEIRAALSLANILDTVDAMPGQLDAMIGERGATLSGGERQRIALARALLADPPILILDEATSSLDSESEARVQQAIDRLIVGRTTLVIAHRLSTIQRANRIIVLEKGSIVEEGPHAELLARNGLYAKLHSIQFAA